MKSFYFCILAMFLCLVCYAGEQCNVNSFDAKFMKPYNNTIDRVGTGLTAVSLATPAILLCQPKDQYLTFGTMYAETLALTYGTKEILKHFVDRDRPYTYFEGFEENNAEEWDESFPSGHTAAAFASAAFTSYVYCKANPNSKYKLPVVLSCGALALATAVTRVESGNHFPTDVLAGAAIGTFFGIVVPMLHTLSAYDKASGSPFVLCFSFGF